MESGELMEEGGARRCSMISWARGHVLGKSSVHVHPTKQSAAATGVSLLASDVGLILVSEEVAFDVTGCHARVLLWSVLV